MVVAILQMIAGIAAEMMLTVVASKVEMMWMVAGSKVEVMWMVAAIPKKYEK